jgi:hypothetical protein
LKVTVFVLYNVEKLLVFAPMDLNDYLRLNSNAMVDLVERKFVPGEMYPEVSWAGQGSKTI